MRRFLTASAICAVAFLSSCADSPSVSENPVSPENTSVTETTAVSAVQTTVSADIAGYTFTDNELLHDTVWKTYTDRGTFDIPQLTFEGGDKVRYETPDLIIEGTAAYPAADSTEGVLLFGKCTYTFQIQPTSPQGLALTFVSGDDILPQKSLFRN